MLEGSIPASYQHERSILQVNFLAQFGTKQNNHFPHNLKAPQKSTELLKNFDENSAPLCDTSRPGIYQHTQRRQNKKGHPDKGRGLIRANYQSTMMMI